jgi:fumarate reductase flavoprotein subunit
MTGVATSRNLSTTSVAEAAAAVLARPGGVAWIVFDSRIAGIARQIEDFRRTESVGAILSTPDVATLAARTGLPLSTLTATWAEVTAAKAGNLTDGFGRNWSGAAPLAPPYCAACVTGSLFHTQGGLLVDANARVLDTDGRPLPGLFAAGGAACGVSGARAHGSLSGNGLLTAVAYGYLAGTVAGKLQYSGLG